MEKRIETQFITNNCIIDEFTRQKITLDIENETLRFPNQLKVHLVVSQTEADIWSFDLSMRYNRGHVATSKWASSFYQVIELGLKEFKKDLRAHESQWAVETFHFDNCDEYDFFTEVSLGTRPESGKNISVLVVEDDPAASAVLKATLVSQGCRVKAFDLPLEALKSLDTHKYDLMILDWNLPYMKGGQFLIEADQLLKKLSPISAHMLQIPVVICSSMPLEKIQLPETTLLKVINFWHKSLPYSSILDSVDKTTEKLKVHQHVAA